MECLRAFLGNLCTGTLFFRVKDRPDWGPRQSKYTPPKVPRGLMEALALSLTPWQAPPALHATWYGDTAHDDSRWTATL